MHNKIILGTAQFGMKYGIANKKGKISSAEIFKILNYSKKSKIKYLDTAYSYNKSEKEIGSYFKKTSKKFNLITKLSFNNKESIINQYENSLESLGYSPKIILAHSSKDYLNPNFHKQIKILRKKYLIKHLGVSLYNIAELEKILKFKKPDYVQIPINLLDKRFLNKNILKKLKKNSIKIIGRSVFLQGLFFKKKNFVFKNFKNVQKNYTKINEIAKKEKMTLGELSLNWVIHLKEIDKIIIGIDSLSHLKQNIKIIKKKINIKSIKEINKINLNNNKIIKPYLWKIK